MQIYLLATAVEHYIFEFAIQCEIDSPDGDLTALLISQAAFVHMYDWSMIGTYDNTANDANICANHCSVNQPISGCRRLVHSADRARLVDAHFVAGRRIFK